MESGMVEAGAVFAALIASLRVIEKLVDQKLGKNQRGPVHIDIDQTDMANQMGQMVECLSATGQTLERINERMDAAHDKITRIETLTDNINRVATKTGATAFEIRDSLKDEALERAAEARGAAKALAKVGD
tara:strand:+ start:264 stop:656 length:393 start_codon:yes stop_codon:yes gene_type:complete